MLALVLGINLQSMNVNAKMVSTRPGFDTFDTGIEKGSGMNKNKKIAIVAVVVILASFVGGVWVGAQSGTGHKQWAKNNNIVRDVRGPDDPRWDDNVTLNEVVEMLYKIEGQPPIPTTTTLPPGGYDPAPLPAPVPEPEDVHDNSDEISLTVWPTYEVFRGGDGGKYGVRVVNYPEGAPDHAYFYWGVSRDGGPEDIHHTYCEVGWNECWAQSGYAIGKVEIVSFGCSTTRYYILDVELLLDELDNACYAEGDIHSSI